MKWPLLLSTFILASCGSNDEPKEESYVIDQAAPAPIADTAYSGPNYSSYGQPASYGGTGYSAGEEDDDKHAKQREPFDEDDARQKAENDLSYESYRSIGRPYGCTIDCSGHEAGFKYRAGKGYGSRIAGDHDARSFRQGQEAYDDEVNRRVEEDRDEYESADEE